MHHRVDYFEYNLYEQRYIIATEKKSLVYLGWNKDQFNKIFPINSKKENRLHKKIKDQLVEYLDGDRKEFNILTKFYGTKFQVEVWNYIKSIPYGEIITYRELANKLGRQNAQRAVGAALGKNPIAIVHPCHRIIGKNKSLTGFAGGIFLKEQLLKLESNY